jgi:hypothetical protein
MVCDEVTMCNAVWRDRK